MLSITVYFAPFIVNCSRVQKHPVLNKIAQPMLFISNYLNFADFYEAYRHWLVIKNKKKTIKTTNLKFQQNIFILTALLLQRLQHIALLFF